MAGAAVWQHDTSSYRDIYLSYRGRRGVVGSGGEANLAASLLQFTPAQPTSHLRSGRALGVGRKARQGCKARRYQRPQQFLICRRNPTQPSRSLGRLRISSAILTKYFAQYCC